MRSDAPPVFLCCRPFRPLYGFLRGRVDVLRRHPLRGKLDHPLRVLRRNLPVEVAAFGRDAVTLKRRRRSAKMHGRGLLDTSIFEAAMIQARLEAVALKVAVADF